MQDPTSPDRGAPVEPDEERVEPRVRDDQDPASGPLIEDDEAPAVGVLDDERRPVPEPNEPG